MPDINERIAVWRIDMAQQLGDDAEILNELESHLRDDIANLVQRGEAPERAFEVAMERIGAPATLAPEFAKATTWLPIRFVLGGTALLLGGLLWLIFQERGGRADVVANELLFPHVIAILIGYGLCFAIGGLACCYAVRRAWGDLPFGQLAALNRAQFWTALTACALTIAGVILGSLWSSIALGAFWSWDQREIGGLLVVASQAVLLVSIWRVPNARRWLMFLGILASITVTYAWFGNMLTWSVVIVAFVQAPFLVAGFAPSGWLRRRVRVG